MLTLRKPPSAPPMVVTFRKDPASAAPTPPDKRGRFAPIVAVASGKGGVGKTWFSVSLTCAYARMARRALLVDCDLGLANADVQLGVRPQADLNSVMRGWLEIESAVTPILGGPGAAGGFDFVSGHSGSGALAQMRPEEVQRIAQGVGRLAPLYDRVILDLAAGLEAAVMRFARAAHQVVVITNDEPTALTDAYAFIKVLRMVQPAAAPWVVVNEAENRAAGKRTFDQLAKAAEKYLHARPQFAGAIHYDPKVAEAIRAQTPLCVRHPQSQALEDVERIAETLAAG